MAARRREGMANMHGRRHYQRGHRLPGPGRDDLAGGFARSLRSVGLGDQQAEGMAGMSAVVFDDFVAEDMRSIVTTTPPALAAAPAC